MMGNFIFLNSFDILFELDPLFFMFGIANPLFFAGSKGSTMPNIFA
jgi:hypothetical protein